MFLRETELLSTVSVGVGMSDLFGLVALPFNCGLLLVGG